jgi:hypothetical protein
MLNPLSTGATAIEFTKAAIVRIETGLKYTVPLRKPFSKFMSVFDIISNNIRTSSLALSL